MNTFQACQRNTTSSIKQVGLGLEDFSWSRIAFFVNVKITHAGLATRIPTNIDPGNHWVGVIIDTGLRELCFIDPYDLPAPPELMDILEWWLAQHQNIGFEKRLISHAKQSYAYSCGLLARNAVAHHLLPQEIQLLDPENCDTGHLHVLQDLLQYLSDVWSKEVSIYIHKMVDNWRVSL